MSYDCPENITLAEILHSDMALDMGFNNFPLWEHVPNLETLGWQLQEVRDYLGVPITISSGYRSEALNLMVGGSCTSSHLTGEACDFTASLFGNPKDICDFLFDSEIDFDQIIDEGSWVHIGFRQPMRREYLKANTSTNPTSYERVA